jgi:predicted transcriptional regulator
MKRSKEEIIESILNICKDPANKTRIVYQANLNFKKVDPYLSLLINAGALEASETRPITYRTTSKGIGLLERMRAINAQLGRNNK